MKHPAPFINATAFALILLAASAPSVHAQSPEGMSGMSGMASRVDVAGLPSGPADLALGASLARACMTCHQTKGRDIVGIPPISGFPAPTFAREMVAFKTRVRDDRVMQAIAAALTDQEIMAVAAYYATLPSVH